MKRFSDCQFRYGFIFCGEIIFAPNFRGYLKNTATFSQGVFKEVIKRCGPCLHFFRISTKIWFQIQKVFFGFENKLASSCEV